MGNRISWVIGKVITAICLIMTVIFFVTLANTKLFPVKYLLIAFAVLLVLNAVICALTWTGRRPISYAAGIVLAALFCFLLAVGSRYCMATTSSVKQITTANTETSDVGIYVLAENESAFSVNASSYTYGILAEQDRGNTDLALDQFAETFGFTLTTKEYDGLTDMVNALLNSEAEAIVMNDAYLDVLEDMDEYADLESRIVRVDGTTVVREITNSTFAGVSSSEEADSAEGETTGGIAPFTVFISGVDTRGELTAKTRSDVNILATVNPSTHQILLVSTPRDYFVPLSISNGKQDKLTHAGIYGVQCCMDTLSMLYDIDVSCYVRMNFVGFQDIINALGGVTVHSDYTFSTGDYQFVEGDNEVDGAAALSFVRERHAFEDGDRQRGRDQMYMIKAVINKAASPAILTRYTDVLAAAGTSFETNISYDLISELVRDQLADGGSWNVVTYSVTGSDGKAIPYSMSTTAYVMIPDQSTVSQAADLMNAVLRGETIEQP